jgi:asparagine synthase (glutamine-hydrolysing)
MCGIAGIFHYAEPDRPVDRNILETMTRILAHRGPDGEGFHLERGLGLGHRRLSIVDLSPTGDQPMSRHDGSCWITYNGELYNHASFRDRLASKGYRFRGTSDTETLLYLLEEEGPECLADVNGIFAFAFWEAKKQRLTLARDHLGVKQLYYHDNGSRIVFASEIKALLACPDVEREVDMEGVNQYLHFHTTLFDTTMFKGIRQLRAGEYLQVTRWGARISKYWSVTDFHSRGGNPDEYVRALRDELSTVVSDQLMSDVPVGCFFSGGIDSSVIAAHARKTASPLQCFGIHFTGQGVLDERPYQEEAAKALGLTVELSTLDGTNFPEDLMRLMYFQDQPVIGPAMFPMYYVSKFAASRVKVCLGGQGGDELFGGYARYALANPSQVVRGWFTGSNGTGSSQSKEAAVGGNLRRQMIDRRTIRRLAGSLGSLWDWETGYFNNFANVSETSWQQIFASPEMVNRHLCRETFHEIIARSPAGDPAQKAIHWDMQVYLPGLFHQDDRMSMASSLESRVPLSDRRIAEFAARTPFDLKFRGGASKWVLRKTLSNILPDRVLNRRKVGFDTPAESWIRDQHAGFVRDMLFSHAARSRGLWNIRGVERLLDNPQAPQWFNIVWKLVCIEAWAQTFLDNRPAHLESTNHGSHEYKSPDPVAMPPTGKSESMRIADVAQVISEDGVRRIGQRVLWEAKVRSGIAAWMMERKSNAERSVQPERPSGLLRLFAAPRDVASAMRGRIGAERLARLRRLASEATRGKIFSFGRWFADYGQAIDWHRNPHNGSRWRADSPWSHVLGMESLVGDVKLTWEAARFPQAYFIARAAAFTPEAEAELAACLVDQIRDFIDRNPSGRGVHWSSSQEIVLRQIAWLFGLEAIEGLGQSTHSLANVLLDHALQCASHIQRNIDYARAFVYNNHLLTEALGLYLAPSTATWSPDLERWMRTGKAILEEQADRQIYPDGSYIQQSHNYHRVAMQIYMIASLAARGKKEEPNSKWQAAMERSLDFLLAHQNPRDGRLPNYGANDGALPCVLSTCDFSDFRPTLQALSIQTRGERLYPPGPWDEEACWLLGPAALEAPMRAAKSTSVSFCHSGHHVLRGNDQGSFGTFHCGDLLDRFSQMDMLHLDVWWRGQNVLVDGGTYLYNGPEEWHNHFIRTSSHNTLQLDGHDQMVHLRRFKLTYRTKAKLLDFRDGDEWVVCTGEHYGYQRQAGNCVHRRSVLYVKDDLWIVADRAEGEGAHHARLHWLGGDFPYRADSDSPVALELDTPEGPFRIAVFNSLGEPLKGEAISGQTDPPRGWLSRYYAHKVPVPSLAVETAGTLPLTVVSVLSPHVPSVTVSQNCWSVTAGERTIEFELAPLGICAPAVQQVPVSIG